MCDYCTAEAQRDALSERGLGEPLLKQLAAMLPTDALPIAEQLLHANREDIARLRNTAAQVDALS